MSSSRSTRPGSRDAAPSDRLGQAYYVLHGRMVVQVEDQAYDLGRGSSITIPPGALHTFTVLSPTVGSLVVSLTGGMGRFHADLAAAVPPGRPVDESMDEIGHVLARHDVTMEFR